ncbi:MAG: GEVED domain-containing protein, partial [Ferruginibacter sp.]
MPLSHATVVSKNVLQQYLLKLLIPILMVLGVMSVNGQTTGLYYQFSGATGTYTAITGGTLHASTYATDAIYNVTFSGGFTFTYNGTAYSAVNISNNGFVTFGATAPTAATYNPINSSTGYSGAIAGYAVNLVNSTVAIPATAAPEIRSELVGSAPNREFVVQYKDAARTLLGASDKLNFQIRLHEDGTIRIVYGAFTTTSTTSTTYAMVGLRGAANTDFNTRTVTGTTPYATWATSGGGGDNGSTLRIAAADAAGGPNSVRLISTIQPAAGYVYTFARRTQTGLYQALPYTQNFDAAPWNNLNATADQPGAGIVIWPSTGNASWRKNNEAVANSLHNSSTGAYASALTQAGGGAARFNQFNATTASTGNLDIHLNFSTAGDKNLSFYMRNPGTVIANDIMRLYLSTNGGTTFTQIGTSYAAPIASWTQYTAALGSSTASNVVLRFQGVSDYGSSAEDLSIDEVSVTVSSCGSPTSPTGVASSPTAANLSWTAPGVAPTNGYQWEVRTSGAGGSGATGLTTFGTTGAGVTTAATGASALTAATTYTLYVRSDCGSSTFSSWVASSTFTTPTALALGTPAVTQASTAIVGKSANNEILRINLPTTGSFGSLTLTGLNVSSLNISDADIASGGVKLYYTTTTTFSTTTQIGTGLSFSGGTASFTGLSQALATGNNYIWIAYDIASTATVGNTVDASVAIGGITITAASGATAPVGSIPAALFSPTGTRTINYCTPAPSSVDGTGITNVAVGSINNPTGAEAGNYGNYTAQSTDIFQGETKNVAITYSTGFTYGTKIWVDFNNDLVFSAGELLYTGLSTSANPTTLAATITIPLATPLGSYRMRIGGTDTDAGPTDACYASTYGTFEDYTINVVAPPACIPPVTSAATLINVTTAQANWTVGTGSYIIEYGATGFTPGAGATAGSTSSTVVTALAGATNIVLAGLTANTTYQYYVRQDCGVGGFSINSSAQSFTTLTSKTVTSAITQAATTAVFPGDVNKDILRISLPVTGTGGVLTLTDLVVNAQNTNDADIAASGVKLYYTTTTTFSTATPVSASGVSISGGTITFNGLTQALSSATNYIWVTYDIANSATSGNTVDAFLNAGSITIAATLGATAPGTLPVATENPTGNRTITCLTPTSSAATLITTTDAQANWTGGFGTYVIEYGPTGFIVGTGATAGSASSTVVTALAGATSIGLSGLISGTTYQYYVRQNCGGSYSSNSTVRSFTTVCGNETAPTTVQTFATFTGSAPAPNCWSEATTATVAAPSTLTVANSEWLNSSSFANNGGANVAVKTNLYGTDTDDWIISNAIDLGATAGIYRLKYDIAVTGYNATTSVPGGLNTHIVRVIISTDGGTTWTSANTIKTYTGATVISNTGQTETINLTGYSGVVKIAFVATTSTTANDIDFHIDNFVVETIPTCFEPTALAASAVAINTATIGWTAPSPAPANGYEYYLSTTNTAPNAGTPATAQVPSGTSVGLVSLTGSTTYYFWVRSVCSGVELSTWASGGSFTTLQEPATIPFTENWETGVGQWLILNGTQTNKWVVGSATSNGAGTKALYVSNDAGVTNAYSFGSASVVFATRDISFTAGAPAFNLSFDWKGDGESCCDYMRVWLVPTTFTPTTGTQITALASGGIQLGANYNVQPTYTTASVAIPGTYAGGTYRLIFEWRNDGSTGPNAPSAVDNISITQSCAAPSAPLVSSITTTGATFNWTTASPTPDNGYNWEVRSSGVGGSGLSGLVASGTTTCLSSATTALSPASTYIFYVSGSCTSSSSVWVASAAFNTLCVAETAPTVTQTFSTYVPVCWSEATGVLASSSTLSGTTSGWSALTTFANTGVGTNTGTSINLYDIGDDWLISNQIDLGAPGHNYVLAYDYAVTSYAGTTAQSTLGSHKVDVVISTDGGTTWSNANIIKSYTGTPAGGGNYSNTGVTESVNLAAYSGVIKIAFVATTTSTSPDIDFHIDNFRIAAPCVAPTTQATGASTTSGSSFISGSFTAASAPGAY